MGMQINEEKLHQFMGNVIGQITGACTVACGYVGHELGIYKAMGGKGPMSADAVANAVNAHPRLIREWLDQQASVGFVSHDASNDTYELSPEAAFALADESSPVFVAGGMAAFRAMMIGTEKLISAMKGDGGIAWGDHHPDLHRGTREFFRPAYLNHLTQEWIPALDGVANALESGGTVADVGCGYGESTIQMARAFPNSTFVGFDYHGPSIEEAKKAAAKANLKNVEFKEAGAETYDGEYDLITFCDCLHDMGDPVGIARYAKSKLTPTGSVMLVEPFAHNTRAENHAGPLGGFLFGASTFFCTPCSLSQDVGRAIGAQGGEPGMRAVFSEAGYQTFSRATETPFNIIYQARA